MRPCLNRLLCLVIGAVLLLCGPASAQVEGTLDRMMGIYDEQFDAAENLLLVNVSSPGYHTKFPNGVPAHPTRASARYALGLLIRDGKTAEGERDRDRAARIIERLVSLQDTRPQSRTRGIWSWYMEEPLEAMSAPDFNWADFIGASFGQILAQHRDKLPADVVERLSASLRLACEAIIRRNVGPGYTNIHIMGGVVTAVAGEQLGDEAMLRYGRERLERAVTHYQQQGGFNEYNSPTYTMVGLEDTQRGLMLLRDEASRAALSSLFRFIWETIAQSWHPATQQWAGPHGRAYSELLKPDPQQYILEQAADPWVKPRLFVEALPCPADLRERFAKLPSDPLVLRRTFVRDDKGQERTWGTTWFTQDACLGSVNQSETWVQRRPLIGYIQSSKTPAAVLRLRVLHDGKDFASGGLRIDQRDNRALAMLLLYQNKGYWHLSLDRPAGGMFKLGRLVLRYELTGEDVRVEQREGGKYALIAEPWQAVVQTADGVFNEKPIVWRTGREGSTVYVEAVLHEGGGEAVALAKLGRTAVVSGVELMRVGESGLTMPVEVQEMSAEMVRATWGPMSVGGAVRVR
jgi:hypothetical protein